MTQLGKRTEDLVAARTTELYPVRAAGQGGEGQLVAEMTATIATVHEDVVAGRLALDPEAGARILSMLRDQLARVESWLRRAQGLARRAPLGENPVGHAMAAKFEHRAGAVDDDMSLAGVLMLYRRVLVAAHDAVDQAMRAYRQVEDDSFRTFTKLANE